MRRLPIWILVIFVINYVFLIGSTQLQPYEASTWDTFTSNCPERDICWYQISSVRSSAQEAVSVLSEFLPSNMVSDQSVQWQHPEGYEGYARFNQNTIESMEIRFPPDLGWQDQIVVGDVVLALGTPDEIEIAPFGQILLHYHGLFLVVSVRTGMAYQIKSHRPISRLQLFSPYSAAFSSSVLNDTAEATLNWQVEWRGFGSYLQNNP